MMGTAVMRSNEAQGLALQVRLKEVEVLVYMRETSVKRSAVPSSWRRPRIDGGAVICHRLPCGRTERLPSLPSTVFASISGKVEFSAAMRTVPIASRLKQWRARRSYQRTQHALG